MRCRIENVALADWQGELEVAGKTEKVTKKRLKNKVQKML